MFAAVERFSGMVNNGQPSSQQNSASVGEGSSHDRRKFKRLVAAASAEAARLLADRREPEPASPIDAVQTLVETAKISVLERYLRFLDHNGMQTLAGWIGSLVGVLLDGRYFAVLGIWVFYVVHRSRALEGIGRRRKIPIYAATLVVSAGCLFLMGIQINKRRPQTYTPADYAKAIKNGLPLPVTQQVTNIYQDLTAKTPIAPPRIDLTEPVRKRGDADGMYLQSEATNNGGEVARDVAVISRAKILDMSKESEEEFMSTLEKLGYADAPREDVPPGKEYSKAEPIFSPRAANKEENDGLLFGNSVVYMGLINYYHDSHGRYYRTELCVWMSLKHGATGLCDGHNGAQRIKSPK
jgi:hypothetical protein